MSCTKGYYEQYWEGRHLKTPVRRLLRDLVPQGKLALIYCDPRWFARTSNEYGGLQLILCFPARLRDEVAVLSEVMGNVGSHWSRGARWQFTGNVLVKRMLNAAGLEPDYDDLPHYYPRSGAKWYQAPVVQRAVAPRKRKALPAAPRQAMRKAS